MAQMLIILPHDFDIEIETIEKNNQNPSKSTQRNPSYESGPPDGHFNEHPVFHQDYKEGFHSNSHCIGENFNKDAWKFRSCHFQNLCFDTEDNVFVLFTSPEQKKLDQALSHSKWDLFWPATSMHTTVSVGGLNPKWGKEHEDLEWYPALRSVEDLKSQGGHYVMEHNKILVPWHSMGGFNPGHLVWDDFLPLFTLLSIFDLTEKNLVLIRYDLHSFAMRASCQSQWAKCAPMVKKFLPLLGTELGRTSTQNDTQLQITAGSKKSKYVCAPNGAAGLGMLTDHGTKLHGWEKKDYKYAYNVGRGGSMYQFRNWMVDNLIGEENVPRKTIRNPPYRIVFSNASSKLSTRSVSFHNHAELLKKRLGGKYALDVREVKLSNMSIDDQVKLTAQTSIFITMCGGGAVSAMFLPKGGSVVAFFNDRLPDGSIYGDTPPRLDWDLLNHIGYLRVHWLPNRRDSFTKYGEPKDLQSEADLDAFVSLIDHELDLISHSSEY